VKSKKARRRTKQGARVDASWTGIAVGVHLGATAIRLARRVGPYIEAVQSVLVPAGVGFDSPEYAKLLIEALQTFCSGVKPDAVWASASFPAMTQRNLILPDVEGRQLASAVRWSLRRELSSTLKDMLVDYTVVGKSTIGGRSRVAIVACAVQEHDVVRLKRLFHDAGYPLTGLTVPGCPFAHLVHRAGILNEEHDTIFLHIGGASSYILFMSGDEVVIRREFKLGVNSFMHAILGDEATTGEADALLKRLCHGDGTCEVCKYIVTTCSGVLQRLFRQYDMTLQARAVQARAANLRDLYLSGPLAECAGMRESISEHVGLPVAPFNPLSEPFVGDRKVTREGTAADGWYVPACGLAYATEHRGLNLLKPSHLAVERKERRALHRFILYVFLSLTLVGSAIWGISASLAHKLSTEITSLQASLKAVNGGLTTARMETLVAEQIESEKQRMAFLRERWALALIAELTQLTPNNIEWQSTDLSMAALKTYTGETLPPGVGASARLVTVTGFVYGDAARQASDLAAYQVLLEQSPLFLNVKITRRVVQRVGEQLVLAFRIEMVPDMPASSGEEQP
jgi:Tfp pilus assembly PilM family ATPase